MAEPSPPWAGYREIPPRLNITGEVLERPIDEGAGARAAILYEGGALTYSELLAHVNSAARGLEQLGVHAGELVLVRLPNSQEFATTFLAVVKLGAIPVLVNSLLGPAELSAILEQTRPRFAVVEDSRAAALREVRTQSTIEATVCVNGSRTDEITWKSVARAAGGAVPTRDTSAHEPGFIVCTSGTTGRPKAIVHAHRWIVALGDLNRFRLPPEPHDVVMATGEWSFISALGHNLLFPLRNGVACAILRGRATPENILHHIEALKVTVLHSVATVYRRMLATQAVLQEYDRASLRCVHSTGEALREVTYGQWKERFGCEIYEHYGVSEFQLVVGQGPRHPVKPGSVGRPAPGVGIMIVDESGRRLPPGQVGRAVIAANDPGLFLEYYGDRERTETALRGGSYDTGDLAYEDEDGDLFIAGRSDDCFKSRGLFIAPTEIENALQRHPAVAEAAVVPEPDPEIGNKILAFVALGEGFEESPELEAALLTGLRDQIAHFKIPNRIVFVASLPKSPIGKILRSELTVGL